MKAKRFYASFESLYLGLVALCLLSFVCQSALANEPSRRSVTDMTGRSVSLPDEIHRIGTLGAVGVLNTFVEAMGEGSKIVNRMPASFANSDRWKLQYVFAPQIKNGPLFENANRELLIENILMAKPDVIFTMSRETAGQLERVGLPCVYLEWNSADDIKAAVYLMGQALNKQDTAREYITWFDEKVALAELLIENIPETKRPRVLYGNPLQLSQPHAIAEWWIRKGGGISVTANMPVRNSAKYGQEDLFKWDPEIIILSGARRDVDEIRNQPKYRNIAAVKNASIHVIPTVAHSWGNRTVEQPLTILWAMHKIHPNLISRAELAKEIRYFYKTFFLHDFSDAQIEDIIDGKFNAAQK
ncbi:MAG: ABC transporter substrate-binding protein [Betaproteobacteria bacterium]|nr:ABC transporter substrate-binding protein [Betaproteobacteria bacterium]